MASRSPWARRLMASVAMSISLLSAACSSQGNHLRSDDLRRVNSASAAQAADAAAAQIQRLDVRIGALQREMDEQIARGRDFSAVEAEIVRSHEEMLRLRTVQTRFFDGFIEDLDITNGQLKAAEQAVNPAEAREHFKATRSMVNKLEGDLAQAERDGNKKVVDELRPLVDLLEREADLELGR